MLKIMLKVCPHHIQAIQSHAEMAYPEECCGLLLGHLEGEIKWLVEVVSVENCWDAAAASESFPAVLSKSHGDSSKRDRFAIAPTTMLQIQRQARDRKIAIVGIYHSHPDQAAVPSEFDRTVAWEQYSYIIVSVQQGIAQALQNWRLDAAKQFQSEEILKIDTTAIAND